MRKPENMENKVLIRLSKTLSYLMHPLMIPTLAVALLLFGNTVMAPVPPGAKWFLIAVTALNTLVIPALTIGVLHTFRLIPDLSLNRPKDRILPMVIVAACYLICAFMLRNMLLAFLIRRFLLAALGCLLLAFIVTLFWKISLHMTAAGGLVAMMFILNFSGFATFPYTLLAVILLAGMLGSARLLLGYHKPAQVLAGFCGGMIVSAGMLLFG